MSEIEKTLDTLAEEINAEHRACEEAAVSAVQHATRAGEKLSEVKTSLKHGEWLPWLEKNFDGTPRTAQVYMRLYDRRDELNTQHASHLSIRGALKELSAPNAESTEAETASLAELEARAEAAQEQALSGTYEAAKALREIADSDPARLAGAIAMLARTHDEENVREVLGFAWEQAFQEYKLSVSTNEEEWRLRTLRAVDEHVRPVDLLPSRHRFAFEDELTYREMNTTFADLIAGGHVADHTRVAHHLRVMKTLAKEGPPGMWERYLDALEQGTVRPVPEDEDDELVED